MVELLALEFVEEQDFVEASELLVVELLAEVLRFALPLVLVRHFVPFLDLLVLDLVEALLELVVLVQLEQVDLFDLL